MLLFLENIGGSEVLMILLFILIFFGSKSIPGIARSFGRFTRQVRDATQDIQDEIKKTTTEIQREVNVNKALHDANLKSEGGMKDIAKEVENIQKKANEELKNIEESIEKDTNS